jgi:D-sedoheptulose 7-phosphate isomerase
MKRTQKQERGPLERLARELLRGSGTVVQRVERGCAPAVAAAAEALVASLEAGGTAYFCGNGGSAADAQHLACELAGRYLLDRPGLAAVALTTNSSSLTAIGNDFGFDEVFARQLEGVGAPGDVLVAISTSGNSANVLRAVEVAHAIGMTVIGMTGRRGTRLAARSDVALVTPSDATPRIQEGHIVMGHALCEIVERALFPPRDARSPRRARSKRTRSRRRGASA